VIDIFVYDHNLIN